jgi:hypothetical protein
MSAGGKIKQIVSRSLDWLVGVMSGTVPIKGLEGSNAYRVTVGLVVGGLGVGGWLIWKTISGTTLRPVVTTNTTPIAELEKLQQKDTDSDGLSDYVELFSYQTSPYLGDSDSDGVSDAQEVAKQTDPNCPATESCGVVSPVSAGDGADLPPEFLRQALKASGVPQATLDGLEDEDIVRLYAQVSQQAATTNVSAPAISIEQLESLSAADIRQLMREAGIDEATLNQIDDSTLKEIFKQAITSE